LSRPALAEPSHVRDVCRLGVCHQHGPDGPRSLGRSLGRSVVRWLGRFALAFALAFARFTFVYHYVVPGFHFCFCLV
jgi:hypothetical protein